VSRRPGQEASDTGSGSATFVWLTGRPALDLCNTRLGASELLGDTSDLARWMSEAGLARGVAVGTGELAAARGLRDRLRAGLLGRDAAGLAAIAEEWLGGVPGRLCVERETLRTRFEPGAATTGCALVAVVLDALDIARERLERVRECAAPPCAVVYLDESRNRSRRWCSMERCGARAKSAAYHRRHAGRPPA
jgi:predicted RNA-binding Zn ribbon-like protein